MTSLAQIKANQNNAKKSTGPKTELGKKRSSQNAITHGMFASIPLLPGEDQESLTALADGINETFQPQDTMELMLVERIITATFRQIRLREAEAANIKISMTPKNITSSLNQALNLSPLEKITPDDLSERNEKNYQYFLAATTEIDLSSYIDTELSIEFIEKNMPRTFGLLETKCGEYEMDWVEFIKDPKLIKKAITEIKVKLENIINSNQMKHTAYHLVDDIKKLHRIPQLKDMALFSKYQVQFDSDLYRAMNALDKYRNSKPKIIEGELVED